MDGYTFITRRRLILLKIQESRPMKIDVLAAVPEAVTNIQLSMIAYDDCYVLRLFGDGEGCHHELWESDWYDIHCDCLKDDEVELRETVTTVFNYYKLDTADIKDFDEKCVFSWEYNKPYQP